jgi:hypothetical protein
MDIDRDKYAQIERLIGALDRLGLNKEDLDRQERGAVEMVAILLRDEVGCALQGIHNELGNISGSLAVIADALAEQ